LCEIYQTEGIKGFYKGFTPCLIRSIPANSSAFLAMELILNHLP
jgi:solute carrier family 25 carnitine/acylcarnitine transporter 20/29